MEHLRHSPPTVTSWQLLFTLDQAIYQPLYNIRIMPHSLINPMILFDFDHVPIQARGGPDSDTVCPDPGKPSQRQKQLYLPHQCACSQVREYNISLWKKRKNICRNFSAPG